MEFREIISMGVVFDEKEKNDDCINNNNECFYKFSKYVFFRWGR